MIELPAPYYPPSYALVSGGKDSLTTATVLAQADRLLGCVALETTVCVPEWKDFVADTCARQGWPLEFFKTGDAYDDLVRRFGFPGPGKHGMFMNFLKGRGVRKFKKAHPDGILASGTRINESDRRFINTKPISVWEGVPILTPIYDLTTEKTWHFFRSTGLQRSPAYETLQISGDCLCGAYAREDELDAVNYHYPCIGKRFDFLSHELNKADAITPHRREWGWGWKQPRKKSAKEAAICVECGDAPPLLKLMEKSDDASRKVMPTNSRSEATPTDSEAA